MQKKEPTSVRLTPEAKRLLTVLSNLSGVSQAAVLEILIREKAKRERLYVAQDHAPLATATP
jgi:predicted DNA-binding protein